MKKLILIIILIFPLTGICQEIINQTDAGGKRQGLWKKQYPNGKLMYEGKFSDDKPTGNWKRYHDNGKIQAEITYQEKTDSAFTKLFDKQGNRIAVGIFLNQKKAGNWRYFLEGKLVSEDFFVDGAKYGTAKKYYQTGELLEVSEWKNNLLDGKYQAFFKSGKPYLECLYRENKRDGFCMTYFESGKTESETYYKAGTRHGDWKFYNENGGLWYILKYKDGLLINPATLDSIQNTLLNQLDQNKGKIVDPEKFIENPEEYMRRQK